MRVLVCGDRNWDDFWAIYRELATLSKDSVIIQGEAKGADDLAKWAAWRLGLKVESYPADWEKYGKSAGPIRNQQMLDEGKPDFVYAFHNNLENSKGTKDMVKRARKAGIPVGVFHT